MFEVHAVFQNVRDVSPTILAGAGGRPDAGGGGQGEGQGQGKTRPQVRAPLAPVHLGACHDYEAVAVTSLRGSDMLWHLFWYKSGPLKT